MAEGRYIAYYRVSTRKQGASGLGLAAQKKAVRDYLDGGHWSLLAEYTEVESGKRDTNRPRLAKALRDCRLRGAALVIAKLDRLSRDAHFLLGLEKAGVDFTCVDMPNANRMTVGIMAVVAEEERRMISARTVAALAAAKARGVKLGGRRANLRPVDPALGRAARTRQSDEFARNVAPEIAELRESGLSLAKIAGELERRGIRTMRGGRWSACSVRNALLRTGVGAGGEKQKNSAAPAEAGAGGKTGLKGFQ